MVQRELIEKWEKKKDDLLCRWNEALVTDYPAEVRRCREQVSLINQFLSDLKEV